MTEKNVVAFGKKVPLANMKLGGTLTENGGWYEHDLKVFAPITAKHHAPARVCFDVRLSRQRSTVQRGGFHPVIIVEGESGYQPTTFDIGGDMATCEANVKAANEALGLTEKDVSDIIRSSMF